MKGKLIVIEGTDCSGKETQSLLLESRVNDRGINSCRLSFPMYDTSTGKIISACYLGKKEECNRLFKGERDGLFSEGASNVDHWTSSLYYAADRRYNSYKIRELLDSGVNVILDRYIYSNLAHQGGKISDKRKRYKYFNDLLYLEFDILDIPKPDMVIFLYVPYLVSSELKKNRSEGLDQNERDSSHLINAENTYFEIASLYDFDIINCVSDNKIRDINDINDELYDKVLSFLESEDNGKI